MLFLITCKVKVKLGIYAAEYCNNQTMCFRFFNYRAHIRTRNVVERGIGQLKRRFHVLHSEIRVNPPLKVCQLVYECAMLHNVCKQRNIPLDDEHIGNQYAAPVQDVEAVPPPAGEQETGRAYRDHIANTHFRYNANPIFNDVSNHSTENSKVFQLMNYHDQLFTLQIFCHYIRLVFTVFFISTTSCQSKMPIHGINNDN